MSAFQKVLAPGTLLAGNFEITDVIGVGGMAVVYSGRQRSMDNRTVAIKVLDPALAKDPAFRRRFKREAGLIGRLEHPNIVPVYDFGSEGDRLFIAMQQVRGETLAGLLRTTGTSLSGERALAILKPIADALDYAHREGLLHRDIKPENILIQERTGHPFLADFGIAQGADTTAYTATGGWVGTLRYASPEQIREEQLTPSADLYSFAVIAYQALTGAPGPYRSISDYRLQNAHFKEQPLPLLPADEPAATTVYAALAAGLAKTPADRHRTVTGFVDEIASAVDDRPELLARRPMFQQARPAAVALPDLTDWLEDDADDGTLVIQSRQLPTPSAAEVSDTRTAPASPARGDTAEIPVIEPPAEFESPPLVQRGDPANVAAPVAFKSARAARVRSRRIAAPRWWPVPIAAASLLVPLVAAIDRPPAIKPTSLSAGSAQFQVAAGTDASTSRAPIADAALGDLRIGGSTTAIGTAARGAALIQVSGGRTQLAPPAATKRTVVSIAGGRGRRYTTARGTILVAQTASSVLWVVCHPAVSAPCERAIATLTLRGARLEADPIPAVATAVRDALEPPRASRIRLQLPVHDLARRRARARSIAAAYNQGAVIARKLAATRPRDRDARDLAAELAATATSFTAIAAAAEHRSTTADARGRASLRADDQAIHATLTDLSLRGYDLQSNT